jgi:hypothetical protein
MLLGIASWGDSMLVRSYARVAILALIIGCGQFYAASAPAADSPAANRAPVWLICDDLNGAVILTVSAPNTANEVILTEYAKSDRTAHEQHLTLGEADGAAGSTYHALMRNGADVGHLRMLNAGAGVDAEDVTTPALTEILLADHNHECRWLQHTRFVGFDASRSFWILEDRKGGLTYQTFDFANAANARALELDGGQRSTAPSVEVSGGQERVEAAGAVFTFDHEGWRYEVQMPQASVTVLHNGARVQTRALLAYETSEDRD